MKIIDIIKILLLLVFIGFAIFTYSYYQKSVKDLNVYNNEPINVNPATISEKKNCVSVRTECNPADPESCNNACNETALTCVRLQDYTPAGGEKINGGGFVCLPENPNLNCDSNRGGVLAWTGYSFVGKQGWSCLCMYPDRFTGEDCSETAPAFCAGGTVNTNNLKGQYPDNSVCQCPEGKRKLINSYNNLPFCADSSGQISLTGNYKLPPSWYNIYFNTDYQKADSQKKAMEESSKIWAKSIADQLFWDNPLGTGTALLATGATGPYVQFVNDVQGILLNGKDGYKPQENLYLGDDPKIANEICNKACTNYNVKPTSILCDCNQNIVAAGSYPNYLQANRVTYTYYQGANYPDT